MKHFKMFADSTYKPESVNRGAFQAVMPWTRYAGMKTEDLSAVYEYLRTMKPVEKSVVMFKPSK